MLATIVSDNYKWMLAFHILFAMVWIGGNTFIQFITYRAKHAGENEALAWLTGQIEWWGTRVLIPTSLLLIILGFGLLSESDGAWELSQFWVSFGLGVWILSFIAGAGFLGPESGRLGKMLEERGPDDPEYQARLARIFLVSRIELVLLMLVVLDMAVKPFL
jgi:uncharacterized membrane protein